MALVPGAVVPTEPPAPQGTVDVIVTFDPGVDVEQKLQSVDPVEVGTVFEQAINGASITVTTSELEKLQNDPTVARVELNTPVHALDVASWGIDRIDQTWLPLSQTYGPQNLSTYGTQPVGGGVRVYVIDTGVSPHSQFGDRLTTGWTIFSGGSTADCYGHGTHVAGTIAGSTYGVAPGATIVPVRVLYCNGAGFANWTINGIDWALNDWKTHFHSSPAVINLSLGGDFSQSMNDAVENAVAQGMTVVVAAGNENQNACNTSPASAPSAITVAATSSNDSRWSWSNYGSCVDLFAPGANITSADYLYYNGSTVKTGTSMAAPHVAGAIAVLASQSPGTPAELTSRLLASATPNVVTSINRRNPTPNLLVCVPPVGSMSIDPVTLPAGMVGTFYSQPALTAQGGSSPYRWRIVSGQLPRGVTLSQSGVLSGTSRSAVSTTLTVQASSNTCQSATGSFSLTIVPKLGISTRRMPGGTVGIGFSAALTATGGSGGNKWSSSPTLPGGLVLDPDSGIVSGTPTTAGTFTATFTVTDANGFAVSKSLSIRIR